MQKVSVADAVGMVLCHDITRIIPGREKCRAFRRGQLITSGDVSKLRDLGKEHIYVWESLPDLVHEDEAAIRLARRAAGTGLYWDEPSQGKVSLKAQYDGLFRVRVNQLNSINCKEGFAFATLHDNRVVSKNQVVAGTRIIPLTIERRALEEAEEFCDQPVHLCEVKPFRPLWVGIITTGNEVYQGRIRDCFGSAVKKKVAPYGARLLGQVIVPDDPYYIAAEIRMMISEGADLVLVTGGMSVDPDDVTPSGIRASGAEVVFYGAPVLPGSMFMLAYQGHVPICGLPGCVMYNKTTIFDLVLPRVFAGERINRSEIAVLGHGGLCQGCRICRYPDCAFGKTAEL
ncbi:MAG: molybdopterin-binding protein [Desulfitobacteriaceae bacterium]|nr:molybdopterin-binding protein [Desulfitobacteriaceae bacterium]